MTTNNYLIEFENLDGCYQYESFIAGDKDEAVNVFKQQFPRCEPYNIFVQVD